MIHIYFIFLDHYFKALQLTILGCKVHWGKTLIFEYKRIKKHKLNISLIHD